MFCDDLWLERAPVENFRGLLGLSLLQGLLFALEISIQLLKCLRRKLCIVMHIVTTQLFELLGLFLLLQPLPLGFLDAPKLLPSAGFLVVQPLMPLFVTPLGLLFEVALLLVNARMERCVELLLKNDFLFLQRTQLPQNALYFTLRIVVRCEANGGRMGFTFLHGDTIGHSLVCQPVVHLLNELRNFSNMLHLKPLATQYFSLRHGVM